MKRECEINKLKPKNNYNKLEMKSQVSSRIEMIIKKKKNLRKARQWLGYGKVDGQNNLILPTQVFITDDEYFSISDDKTKIFVKKKGLYKIE